MGEVRTFKTRLELDDEGGERPAGVPPGASLYVTFLGAEELPYWKTLPAVATAIRNGRRLAVACSAFAVQEGVLISTDIPLQKRFLDREITLEVTMPAPEQTEEAAAEEAAAAAEAGEEPGDEMPGVTDPADEIGEPALREPSPPQPSPEPEPGSSGNVGRAGDDSLLGEDFYP